MRIEPMLRTLTAFAYRCLLIPLSVIAVPITSASAQIRTDGSVGPARSLLGPNVVIGADLGKQVGANLFHSFTTFNVGRGESATFTGPSSTGPSSVGNIISRVTGGQTSQVDGRIASTIPGANLFLLNPSGWVFGSHATLNVQGSVHVSSTDTLHFADGTRLPTGTPTGSSFTSAPPEAFGFLSSRSGAISVTGSRLTTPVGKDLSLVGGPVRIEGGQVLAPAGKLHIASAASAGKINLNGSEAPAPTAPAYGPVTVSGNAIADVGDGSGQRGGGAVQVRGGAVLIDSSTVGASNASNQPGGTISVKADALTLRSGGTLTTSAQAGGNAGPVTVMANRIDVNAQSIIGSRTYSTGNAGQVQLTGIGTNTSLTIDGGASTNTTGVISHAVAGSSGAAGNVAVSMDNIRLFRAGQISSSTFSSGNAGPVTVHANALSADGGGRTDAATGVFSS
ncbi:MAG: filamentous hemagglutinin N-terminal domain-containing protein, partial [Rhodopila sp.]